MKSWVDSAQGSDFPIENLPLGIFSVGERGRRPGVAIGDYVLDLTGISDLLDPDWVEDLSQILGFSYNAANNYAVSGSESDELGLAIAKFPGTGDSAKVLFAIWSDNNDIANHLDLGYDDSAWTIRINRSSKLSLTASVGKNPCR